eukprot:scaffold8667_cov99-Amphora_coffeaeformis.AAC.1
MAGSLRFTVKSTLSSRRQRQRQSIFQLSLCNWYGDVSYEQYSIALKLSHTEAVYHISRYVQGTVYKVIIIKPKTSDITLECSSSLEIEAH